MSAAEGHECVSVEADWDRLARVLALGVGEQAAAEGRPVWVAISGRPGASEEFEVTLIVDDRVGTLGWTAPPDCSALAVVATGRVEASGCPDDLPVGLAARVTEGARLACVVSRDGAIGWYMAAPGNDESVAGCPSEGRLLDILLRSLGRPTAPPPDTGELDAVLWLGAIFEAALATSHLLTWTQVQALRPDWSGDATRFGRSDHNPLVSWEQLRRDAIAGMWHAGGLTRDEVAWMDEGMFARWVLAELPLGSEILASLRPHLTPAAARRLAHAIR